MRSGNQQMFWKVLTFHSKTTGLAWSCCPQQGYCNGCRGSFWNYSSTWGVPEKIFTNSARSWHSLARTCSHLLLAVTTVNMFSIKWNELLDVHAVWACSSACISVNVSITGEILKYFLEWNRLQVQACYSSIYAHAHSNFRQTDCCLKYSSIGVQSGLFRICMNHKARVSLFVSFEWGSMKSKEGHVFPFSLSNSLCAFFFRFIHEHNVKEAHSQVAIICFTSFSDRWQWAHCRPALRECREEIVIALDVKGPWENLLRTSRLFYVGTGTDPCVSNFIWEPEKCESYWYCSCERSRN